MFSTIITGLAYFLEHHLLIEVSNRFIYFIAIVFVSCTNCEVFDKKNLTTLQRAYVYFITRLFRRPQLIPAAVFAAVAQSVRGLWLDPS